MAVRNSRIAIKLLNKLKLNGRHNIFVLYLSPFLYAALHLTPCLLELKCVCCSALVIAIDFQWLWFTFSLKTRLHWHIEFRYLHCSVHNYVYWCEDYTKNHALATLTSYLHFWTALQKNVETYKCQRGCCECNLLYFGLTHLQYATWNHFVDT